MDYINILHLSDIHFKRKVTDTFRNDVKKRILEAIEYHISKERFCVPNFVAITGDIAFSGKEEEYEEAEKFLNEIRVILQESAEFLIVQGNHDLDRDKLDRFSYIHSIVKNHRQVDEFLEQPDQIRHKIIPKFQGYLNFVKKMNPDLYQGKEDFFWVKNCEESNVSFLGLNSCWACEGDQDKSNITLGYPQVLEALSQSKHPNKILLMHHPTENWFYEEDFRRYSDDLYKNCSLILHGHTHYDLAHVIQSPSYSYILLATNASYAKYEDGFLGFQFIQVTFKENNTVVKVWPYRSEFRGRVRFVPDTNRYESQDGPFFTLSTSHRINTSIPVSQEMDTKSIHQEQPPMQIIEEPLLVRVVPDHPKIAYHPWPRLMLFSLFFLITLLISIYMLYFEKKLSMIDELPVGNLTEIAIGYTAPAYVSLGDENSVVVTVLNTSAGPFTGTITLAFSPGVSLSILPDPNGNTSFKVENLPPAARFSRQIRFMLHEAPAGGTFKFQLQAVTPYGRNGTTKWHTIKMAPFPFPFRILKLLILFLLVTTLVSLFWEKIERLFDK